ncbi:16S rRNA (guanine(527)-N(7))-methyltransferase RsmG [Prochlorococcus sp. MIT 1341]|uniref:16S rRNA (guanine(527)-N(7))-methyltransferase RsmG n=1 Tax=Prochlorococcus sp. MIT 1341 TaxID=3096221 RepID=UPI002A757D23|nr:16S rRNA (guanine(527)-N(7))-methyltransferase RsmG [Prochlorococcus sp. MIT 1341]
MSKQIWLENHGFGLWEALGWEPSSKQLEQMISIQKLLKAWNQRVNLTRLIHNEDYWVGQIFDSLWPLKKELTNPLRSLRCIDIGSGCGFPGLAIAIALPNSQFTLVDAASKKTRILKNMIEEIGISSRVKILNERAEITGQNKSYRSMFDIAMARAVAPAPIVAEYLIPLLNHTGEAILFRGKWTNDDKVNLTKAIKLLKADLIKIEIQHLPYKLGLRHQIRLKAIASCPMKYPRKVGIPSKHPLGN